DQVISAIARSPSVQYPAYTVCVNTPMRSVSAACHQRLGLMCMAIERKQFHRGDVQDRRKLRSISMSQRIGRAGLVCGLLGCVAGLVWLESGGPVLAETCLSPFVKRLDRPEKFLYVFCVDADAKDHDFLAVIDVERSSPKFGTITYQLDLGSAGNETHHFGFTDDRTYIWGC